MGGGRGDSPAIKPISKSVVHRICSGQVIFDLSSAVKELVENSLDGGATTIEVSLKEYGEEWLKVTDNGSGISPNNFQAIALKHHTSKISEFSDLNSLATFGFRGEALSSLCALGKLTVETRTKDEPVGTHLEFEHSGVVINERKTARQVGTTVTIKKLFSTLPVRSREFSRNIRKEYGKLVSLLNAYALIAKGVRLLCTNTAGRNSKTVVLQTQGSSLRDNIITIFGLDTLKCLDPLSVTISEGCQVEGFLSKPGHGNGRNSGDRQFFYVNGRPVDMPKVSKLINELYRSSTFKQYPMAVLNFCIPTTSYDVNVTPDKRKIFFSSENDIMLSLRTAFEKIFCPQQCNYSINHIEYPEKEENPALDGSNEDSFLIERENVPSPENDKNKEETYSDDNVSPESQQGRSSGTRVTIETASREESPLPKDPSSQVDRSAWLSAFRYEQPKRSSSELKSYWAQANSAQTVLAAKSSRSNTVQSSLMNFVSQNKRKREDSCNLLSEVPVLRRGMCSDQVRRTSLETNASARRSSTTSNIPEVNSSIKIKLLQQHSPESSVYERTEDLSQHSQLVHIGSESTEVPPMGPCDVHTGGSSEDGLHDQCLSNSDAPKKYSEVELENIVSNDPLPSASGQDRGAPEPSASVSYPVMQFTVAELRRRRKQGFWISHVDKVSCQEKITRCYKAATLNNSQPLDDEGKSNSLAAATYELERLFSKDDFGQMQVVGQFNLGFIIGKLDQDLFIVDQHAADEKYNFESLSQSTTLNVQPLLQPIRLELSPEEEVVVSMHMNTIRKNGFVLVEDTDASPGNHFLLKAVPFSKNITFGAQDVKELISMLADSQGDCSMIGSYKLDRMDSICPSRVRAMLASRACRMSIMIGDPLTKVEMKRILKNLTGLRSPWNCPHGRPTMRHLADLRTIKNKGSKTML